jgi:hypothetical protein
MKLTEEQIRELFRRTGNYLNEACDRCGKPLAEVRYTRRGEPGEWCSEICRDGVKPERRRGGRPRLKLSAKGRISHRRKQVRDAVERHRQGVIKNRPQLSGTTGLANTILAFGYPPTSEAV